MTDLDVEQQLREALHEDLGLVVPVGLARQALDGNRRRRFRRVTAVIAPVVAVALIFGAVRVTEHLRASGPVRNGPAAFPSETTPVPNHSGSPGPVKSQDFKEPANQEAAHLLSVAILPPGSTPTSTRPGQLAGQPFSHPADADLVYAAPHVYDVPLSARAVQTYLQTHLPVGLSLSESDGSSSQSGVITLRTLQLSAPDTATYEEATLSYSVAPEGPERSVLLVEAFAGAIDPTPYPAPSEGRSLRITVAGGCPASDRDTHITNADRTGLTTALLPAGATSSALECRYRGLNGEAFALQSHRVLDARTAQSLANEARRTPLGHGDATMSCPAGYESGVYLAFAYAGRPDVDLEIVDDGCVQVDNGIISAGAPPALAALLPAGGIGAP